MLAFAKPHVQEMNNQYLFYWIGNRVRRVVTVYNSNFKDENL